MSGQQSPSVSASIGSLSSPAVLSPIPPQSGPSSSSSFQTRARGESGIAPAAPAMSSEELTEERSKWLTQVLTENPEFLALREQLLHMTGGLSFANVKYTHSVMSSTSRFTVLELIYQHLNAIGMYRTAEVLTSETGHQFQDVPQPWDRTDLSLLASMAVGHREDPWDFEKEPFHQYTEEALEEDLFASQYREDETTVWDEYFDPELNVRRDENGRIVAASLKRLILNALTAGDEEKEKMFLVLHSITSAEHFLKILVNLYDFEYDKKKYPKEVSEEDMSNIKLKIVNFINKWVKYHGLFIGNNACNSIRSFWTRILKLDSNETIIYYAKSYLKLMKKDMTFGTKKSDIEYKEPKIPDYHVIFKQTLTILDPEPIEVARQITLIYHEKFAPIHSLEFIVAIKNQGPTFQTPSLNDFFLFREHIAELFADTYLNAENKNAAYERIFEIISSLNSAEMLNLDAVSCLTQLMLRPDICSFLKENDSIKQKKKQLLEMWCDVGENDKKEAAHPTRYEKRTKEIFDSWSPSIPNMNVEIRQISKEVLDMPDFIDGLINWEKIYIISNKCTILYRSQTKDHPFWPIPQIRNVILRGSTTSSQALQDQLNEIQRINQKLD